MRLLSEILRQGFRLETSSEANQLHLPYSRSNLSFAHVH